jgi:CBS domain-containing protein
MAQAIKDVMTPEPGCVDPHDSAADAARRMRDVESGAVLVAEDGHLRGLLTDRDIVVRISTAPANQ